MACGTHFRVTDYIKNPKQKGFFLKFGYKKRKIFLT